MRGPLRDGSYEAVTVAGLTGRGSPAIIDFLIKDQRSPQFEVVSAEDGVYRALRAEIGRLELAPGLRLPLEELAARFNVSPTPVRHAVKALRGKAPAAADLSDAAYAARLQADLCQARQIFCGLDRGGRYLAG